MKMSEGVEWAIHCCSFLAALPEGTALPSAKLSEFFELPKDYLAKHLQALSRAGIVTTTKGPNGGYKLAKKPGLITLLEIVQAVDGKDPCFQCTEIRQRGPSGVARSNYKKTCGIARAMWGAEAAWRAELKKVSLASLIKEAETNVCSEQMKKAQIWLAGVLA